MKVFFICCVIFLFSAWIILSTEHGKSAGESILKILEGFLGGKN